MGTTHKGGYRVVICVHCGLCCYDFPVAIVAPKYIDFKGEDANDLPEEAFIIKQGNTPCEYLYWEDDFSRCAVHNKPWYPSTPCFDFSQIESSPNNICRYGEWILEKRKTDKRFNYRILCDNFVAPKSPEEVINAFRKDKRKE
jgi:hypothetical protein